MEKASLLIKQIEDGKFNQLFEDVYIEESLVSLQPGRYKAALENFIENFGDRDVEIYSAPGCSELCGNHTWHQRGKMLAAAVNRDMIAVVAPSDNNIITLKTRRMADIRPIPLRNLGLSFDEQGTYEAIVKGMYRKFSDLKYEIGGYDAYIDNDVPVGAGLSSTASFETLLGIIMNGLYNGNMIPVVLIAQIAQFAENVYYGKRGGLMSQAATSIGNIITIDYKDPTFPIIKKPDIDFSEFGYLICTVDTKDKPANVMDDLMAIPEEMFEVARCFGKQYLREVNEREFYDRLQELRTKCSDRALLRAMHFFSEERRVNREVNALKAGNFEKFLDYVARSGNSSFEYLQNVYSSRETENQAVSLAICMSEKILREHGVVRVHGEGFEGTIQAIVEEDYAHDYKRDIEKIFGEHSCHILQVRRQGGFAIIGEKI